jgi:hypothetical protein
MLSLFRVSHHAGVFAFKWVGDGLRDVHDPGLRGTM